MSEDSENQEQEHDHDHPDYPLLQDSIITMNELAKEINSPEEMGAMVDRFVDGESLCCVAAERITTLAQSMPFPQNLMLMQILGLVTGLWQDGFIAAQFFNERKANGPLLTIPDTLEGLDGL